MINASFVASALCGVTLTLSMALGIVYVAERARAALRHMILLAAFGVLLFLPLAAIITPTIAVPMPVPSTPVLRLAMETTGQVATPADSDSPAAGLHVTPVGVARPRTPTVVGVLWVIGVCCSLLPLVIGLREMRLLRYSATSWTTGAPLLACLKRELGIDRRVDLLIHSDAEGPMTCGIVVPAIVLPPDAEQWNTQDLERALVHELEHVRRCDWLSQCVARAICAVYWFHPLAWFARRQLCLEAECACDDAVLARSEPVSYADQLLKAAKRLWSVDRKPLLAMARPHDLKTRIRVLLDLRQARGRAGVPAIVSAAIAVGLLVLTMSPLRVVARASDDQATDPEATRWEAVSIRPCDSSDAVPVPGGRSGGPALDLSPGRLNVRCATVAGLINIAYVQHGDPPPANRSPMSLTAGDGIQGGPGWTHTDKYTIEAEAEGTPLRSTVLGAMLRSLLADRFQLRLHQDVKQVAAFALRVSDQGLKLREAGPNTCVASDPNHPAPRAIRMTGSGMRAYFDSDAPDDARPFCGSVLGVAGPTGPNVTYDATGQRFDRLAQMLSGILDRPVVDETHVDAPFTFHLEFARDENVTGLPAPPGSAMTPVDPSAPTVFAAVEKQLGLKLTPSKTSQGFLVIDRVERPRSDGWSRARRP